MINDNDGAWYGAYVSEGSRMGFVMSVTRSGDGYAGTLTSDGHGFLPEGEWPGDFGVAENTFQVTVSGMTTAKSSIKKRDQVYYLRFSEDGVRQRISSHTGSWRRLSNYPNRISTSLTSMEFPKAN